MIFYPLIEQVLGMRNNKFQVTYRPQLSDWMTRNWGSLWWKRCSVNVSAHSKTVCRNSFFFFSEASFKQLFDDYEQYCSQSPGGHPLVLALPLGSSHVGDLSERTGAQHDERGEVTMNRVSTGLHAHAHTRTTLICHFMLDRKRRKRKLLFIFFITSCCLNTQHTAHIYSTYAHTHAPF